MGLFDLLFNDYKKKEDEDKLRRVYGLNQEERKKVMKGKNKPWDFENDNPDDEDDEYHEDDE